eukprot:213415_1
MLPTIKSLFYLISLTSIICQSQLPTVDDINDLRTALRAEIDASGRFRDLLTATIRLIFHDCSGPHDTNPSPISICNGCIDFSNTDHAGLQQKAVEPLNQLHRAWNTKIPGRADFWATAATIAIEYAADLSSSSTPGDSFPEIPYYFGRKDCISSVGNAQNTKHFPSGDFGWTEVSNWFQQHLGYTDEEIVTIIGAHTLGRTNSGISGYSSYPWVQSREGPDQLNNLYYKNLLTVNWVNQQSAKGKWEWADNQQQVLMMNSDMCLILDFDSYLQSDTGKVTCPGGNNVCPVNSDIRSIVEQYAAQNQLFLDRFAAVFEKLIKTGYSDNELVVVGSGGSNSINNNINNAATNNNNNNNNRRNRAVGVDDDSKISPVYAINDGDLNRIQMILDVVLWVCVVGVIMVCVILLVFVYRRRGRNGSVYMDSDRKCSKYECVDNDEDPEGLISISKM